MTAELEHRPAGALTVRAGQIDWTPDQRAALSHLGIDESVTDADLRVFLTYAQRTGLDPFAKQIYLIGRWDGRLQRKRWTIQAGIDGFRIVAMRSGDYAGQTPAQWCGADGQWRDVWLEDEPPAAARAGVLHRGFAEPLYAVAMWNEYAPRDSKGQLSAMWVKFGALMLHKCAEALALRRAFPHDLSGVYTTDEMSGGGDNRTIDAEPIAPAEPAMTLDELTTSALAAVALAELQETWRQAGRAGLLDAETVDRETGEAVTLRDYLIAQVHNLDAAPAEPVVSADESATPQPDPAEGATDE